MENDSDSGTVKNCVDAHNKLAIMYLQSQRGQEAVDHIARSLQIEPLNRTTVVLAATVFGSLKAFEHAIPFCRNYLDHFPADTELQSLLQDLEKQADEATTSHADVFAALFSALSPGRRITLHRFYFERLGEMVVRAGWFLKRRQSGEIPADKNFIFISGKPANQQLLEMFKRKMPIIQTDLIKTYDGNFDLIEVLFPAKMFNPTYLAKIKENIEVAEGLPAIPEPLASGAGCVLGVDGPMLEWTPEEEMRGQEALRTMGIGPNDWYVTIFARDDKYTTEAFSSPDDTNEFRNASLQNFHKAISYIVEKGGFVVRMGHQAKHPLELKHPRIIDYPFTSHRSDFLDIYLMSKCRFSLDTPSGATDAGSLFGIPFVSVNCVPVGAAHLTPRGVSLPKHVFDRKSGKPVPWRRMAEVLWNGGDALTWSGERQFEELGYLYKENTPDEILAATVEMFDRLEGRFTISDADAELMARYFKIFPERHWAHRITVPISNSFLRDNRALLE